jgi:hypothetical protein
MIGLVTNAPEHAIPSYRGPRSVSADFQVSPENEASAHLVWISLAKGLPNRENAANGQKREQQNDYNMPKVLGNEGIGLRDSNIERALTSGPRAFSSESPVSSECEVISRHAQA